MGDYDVSEISESSYADARADTPTLGEHQSGSEDTLSNLSLDELLDNEILENDEEHPDGQGSLNNHDDTTTTTTSASYASAINHQSVRVCVTDADLNMTDSLSLDLPPGTTYLPETVEFVKSPSQLKILKGPSFIPKEERALSDDESSVSSYHTHFDSNGDAHMVKKDHHEPEVESSQTSKELPVKPNFVIPQILTSTSDENETRPVPDPSLLPPEDDLDDYIEDFILPLSHESVMSRNLSFRRKVRKTYEEIARDKANLELDKFEAMLSTYEEEEEEYNRTRTPTPTENLVINPSKSASRTTPTMSSMNNSSKVPKSALRPQFNLDVQEPLSSILDIDAIVKDNAPNLMKSLTPPQDSGPPLESLNSSYFLPQQTLDKLYAVYESSNFNNIYCLSGEIKNILTPLEIEEILENKEELERIIDPNVMAALHWSLNPSINNIGNNNKSLEDPTSGSTSGLKSKSSSMSNGFHSDASSEEDVNLSPRSPAQRDGSESGIESPSPTTMSSMSLGGRGTPLTASMRRRIALAKEFRNSNPSEEDNQDNMDEIDLGVDPGCGEDEEGDLSSNNSSSLVRTNSKRFKFRGKDGEVIEKVVEISVLEESMNHNPKGTLRRVKAPLNLQLGEEVEVGGPQINSPEEDEDELKSLNDDKMEGAKSQKHRKKKISVDERMLNSMISSAEFDGGDLSQATNVTDSSDIFYSIRNSTLKDEDPTLKSDDSNEDRDDVTLDLDTPDDMQDSIIGHLEAVAAGTSGSVPQGDLLDSTDSMRWKSYRVGPTAEVQIDLQAIQPYRKCLSHGGYFDAEKTIGIILFSGCYLPDRTQNNYKDYTYLMDHLFLYVLSTLEELICEDYILVYLHGATPKSCQPTYGWLKKCYQLISHKLKKNLKGLYLVHPTFWLRTVVALTRPFISTKFSHKIRFINTLSDLCLEIPTEHLCIPDCVLQYDFQLKVDDLKRRKLMS